MIPKLSRACYAITSMSHTSSTDNLKSIYFAYFHSIMKYGILFWGNSPNSKMIFTLQKRTAEGHRLRVFKKRVLRKIVRK
jgi:hypothetical protein